MIISFQCFINGLYEVTFKRPIQTGFHKIVKVFDSTFQEGERFKIFQKPLTHPTLNSKTCAKAL